MLIKLGVYIDRLDNSIRRILPAVDALYVQHTKKEAVITSTYEGNHSASSFHYQNKAIDFRLTKPEAMEIIKDLLGRHIGKDYDIVIEKNHLHVEYDPK